MKCEIRLDHDNRQALERILEDRVLHPSLSRISEAERIWDDARETMIESMKYEPTPRDVFAYGYEIGKAIERGKQESRWVKVWQDMKHRTEGNE